MNGPLGLWSMCLQRVNLRDLPRDQGAAFESCGLHYAPRFQPGQTDCSTYAVASVRLTTPKPSAVLELLGFGGERSRPQQFRRVKAFSDKQIATSSFACKENTTIAVNHCTRVVLIETSS
ncbi:unnamed protein product [Effrenium voratum]|nr:unnamed protein product [Effrenium voratum]